MIYTRLFDILTAMSIEKSPTVKKWVSIAIYITFMLPFSLYIQAAENKDDTGVPAELLQKWLNMARIESEVLSLNRNDGFDEGFYFNNLDGVPIIING